MSIDLERLHEKLAYERQRWEEIDSESVNGPDVSYEARITRAFLAAHYNGRIGVLTELINQLASQIPSETTRQP